MIFLFQQNESCSIDRIVLVNNALFQAVNFTLTKNITFPFCSEYFAERFCNDFSINKSIQFEFHNG